MTQASANEDQGAGELTLQLKAEYFDQIASGEKREEYRLQTQYWSKRLMFKSFRHIVLTRGYPKGGGVEGQTRLTRIWRGYRSDTITHPHFGPEPVQIFAIDVSEPALRPTPSPQAAVEGELLPVTGADRDAAIPLYTLWGYHETCEEIIAGKADHDEIVQAFARHRHEAQSELVEALDRFIASLTASGSNRGNTLRIDHAELSACIAIATAALAKIGAKP